MTRQDDIPRARARAPASSGQGPALDCVLVQDLRAGLVDRLPDGSRAESCLLLSGQAASDHPENRARMALVGIRAARAVQDPQPFAVRPCGQLLLL